MPETEGVPARSLLRRRTFLAVLAGSLGLMAARVAMLPRPLSEAEVARLQTSPYVPNNPRIKPLPTVNPDSGLGPGYFQSFHTRAQQLELAPHVTRWQRSFRINTVERDPQAGLATWDLRIEGLVEQPLTLTAETLAATLPVETQLHDFHCVEGWGVQDVAWEGIPFRAVVDAVRPLPGATHVSFFTMANVYSDSLTLEQALRPDVLVAFRMNGQPLPDRQGYPCRLVVPYMFGYKSVKWLRGISFVDNRHVGFWERRGWPLDPLV
jgi:DMSO/TMAO reductase YedYZ molybdopterin-dependent catalytic subunit